jgi:1-acyl-sn-glycerol-3-phosphate acyltransferase
MISPPDQNIKVLRKCMQKTASLDPTQQYIRQHEPQNRLLRIIKTLLWGVGKLIYDYFFPISYQGIENLPQEQAYLIAANHTSHLDYGAVALILQARKQKIYVLGAEDYFFNHAIKGWFFQTFLDVIPVKRQDNFLGSYRQCKKILQQGYPVMIFPEGTRSVTGEVQAFQSGLGLLAIMSNFPIVPVYINGSYQALPKGAWMPRPHPIFVNFGKPLFGSKYKQQSHQPDKKIYQEITHDVYKAVIKLQQ